MKLVLPGAIEDLQYNNGMVVAVGGDQLKLFSLESQSIGLGRADYVLREHLHKSPHSLLTALQSLDFQGKQIHSVNFTTHNSLVVSFVDSSPLGQHSIL